LWPDQAIEATWFASVRQPQAEDVADIKWPAQEARLTGRRKGNSRVQMGGHSKHGPAGAAPPVVNCAAWGETPAPSKGSRDRAVVVGWDWRDRFDNRCQNGERRAQPSLVCDANGSGDVRPAAMPSPASGGAESVMRAQAVAATMIVAATAIASRQPSTG